MDRYLGVFIEPAQILAAAVPDETRISRAIVAGVMDGYDTHGSWHFLPEPHYILARVLVGPQHGVQDPIGPEDVIPIHGDVEWMLR